MHMMQVMFFKNIVSILAFALIGTVISTAVVGVGLWLVRSWFFTEAQHISMTECLVFGALISATDPVTVLAIFKALNVDFNLYSNCFGESVLNDAVAIVLYGTLITFLDEPLTVASVSWGVAQFCIIFLGSILVGVVVALLSALVPAAYSCASSDRLTHSLACLQSTQLFKYTSMYTHPVLESGMLVLYAYSSYLLAQGLGLSGIVSILFCGIVMAHYTRKNVSPSTKHLSIELCELLAFMSETFVFAYLGLSIFSLYTVYDWSFTLFAIVRIGHSIHLTHSLTHSPKCAIVQ